MSSRRRKHPIVRLKWEAREDEEGRRYLILRWTDPVTGKRVSKPVGFLTPEAAEEARKDREAALRLQVDLPSGSFVRVADVIVAYLGDLDHRPISERYGEMELSRCATIRRLIGHLAAEEVTSATLARYVGDRRREPSRLKRAPKRSSLMMEVDTIRRAFKSAIDQRLIRCPVPGMPVGKLPNDRRPHRRLTEAEVAKLIVAGHEDMEQWTHGGGHERYDGLGWLIQVLAWSGRRPIAVLELTVDDVARLLDDSIAREDQLVEWRRDKGGEGLGLGPVTEPARSALIARAGEVKAGRLWGIVDSKALLRPFHRVALAAGVVGVQPYDLRRFAVTKILDGVRWNLKKAMVYTGHTQEATVLRYSFAPEGSAEAMAGSIGWSPLKEAEKAEEG